MKEPIEPQVMSVSQAGRLLGICRDSAYAAVRDGSLPAIRLGKRIVISKFVIEEMLRGELTSQVGGIPSANSTDDNRAA
jgi:excisionase family DNA binding protein